MKGEDRRIIILDWDGIFVDTADMIMSAYNHLYDMGLSKLHFKDKEKFLEFFDTDWPNNTERMGLYSAGEKAEAIAAYKKFIDSQDKPEVIPEMRKAAEAMRSSGYRVGIASNIEDSSQIRRSLEGCGLDLFVGSIVCAGEVKKLKPDPLMIQTCLKELSGNPEYAICVGDSPNDISAARAAGVGCNIAALWGLSSRDKLSAADPDLYAENPGHLMELIKDA